MAENMAGKTKAERQINLSVLRKLDPEIEEIIDTASSVAHYKFNSISNQWEKTEVEGSLFLYSRKVSPIVAIFIMNRLNKQNSRMILTHDMEFQIQQPFLLCKASNSEIIGIWFYDAAECQRLGALLCRFVVLAKDDRSLKIAIMTEQQKKKQFIVASFIQPSKVNPAQNGILGMFTKAQDEFENFKGKQQNIQKSKQQKCGKQQNQPKTNIQKRNSELMKEQLHAPAKQPSKLSPKSARKEEMRKKQESFKERHFKEQEMLLDILHGGETKKAHRARTVSSSDALDIQTKDYNPSFSSKAGDLAILDQLGVIQEQHRNNGQDVKSKFIGCAELESVFLQSNKSENEVSNRDTIRTAHSSPNIRKAVKNTDKTSTTSTSNMSLSLANSASTNSTVNLLSPSLMTAKTGKGRGTTLTTILNGQQKISIAANFNKTNKAAKKLFPDDSKTENKFPEAPSGAALSSLMSPAAFQLSSFTASNSKSGVVDVLTKQQFQEALLHVIQNDDSFVSTLHAAYLEARKK